MRKAFTIVELLIVVVVIAILAAIVIVSYNGITSSARHSFVQSEASQVARKVAQYAALHNDQFPVDLQSQGFTDTSTTKYEYTQSANSWCATITHEKMSYYVSHENTTPEEGLCSGHIGAIVQGPWTKLSNSEFAHTCGIMTSKAYCWGYNNRGQLGVGGDDRNVPVEVTGELVGKTVTDISAGDSHTCAVADGKAYCWGNGSHGQLGQGNTSTYRYPVAVNTAGVLADKEVTAVSAGSSHSCAIADARMYCWGSNSVGQLGNGTNTSSNVPVAVSTSGSMSGDVAAISVKRSSCALSDGKVYCWGQDLYGYLGDGGGAVDSNIPVAVDTSGSMNGETITAIAMGAYHVLALAESGLLYVWGMSPYGLGNGSTAHQYSPSPVTMSGVLSGKQVTAISSGGYNSCAVASGGIYCWGQGTSGQLGNNANSNSSLPVAVNMTGVLTGRPAHEVASGTYHTCALATGEMYCWGRNNWRQLGDGNTVDVNHPAQVAQP